MGKRIGLFFGSAGSNSGGPERYETELLRGLAAADSTNAYEVFCLFEGGPKKIGVTAPNVRYHVLQPQIRPLAMMTSLPLALRRHALDVLHATFLPPPLSPHPYMFTLVCSSMFERPDFYPPLIRARLLFLMGLAMKKSKLIVCISRHIKECIQERFGIAEERLAVVHLAASDRFVPIERASCAAFLKERYGIEGRYLLFSGRWERRKNIARILEAFDIFRRESRSGVKLVLTGERTWAAREAEEIIRTRDLAPDLVDVGKSPVDELPYLYAGAEALVYPSLWEGFGLPIVEAMRAGTPVITSNNTSMKEIGGDAALLVDPNSADEIAAAMHRIVAEPEFAQALRTRGLVRGQDFSWESTARQTMAAHERFLTLAH